VNRNPTLEELEQFYLRQNREPPVLDTLTDVFKAARAELATMTDETADPWDRFRSALTAGTILTFLGLKNEIPPQLEDDVVRFLVRVDVLILRVGTLLAEQLRAEDPTVPELARIEELVANAREQIDGAPLPPDEVATFKRFLEEP